MKKLKGLKKYILIVCALALLCTAAVSITMAYMTDSEEKINTFTVGDLDIKLTEPKWDSSKGLLMQPGDSIDKDPTVELLTGSADSFVRLRLNIDFSSDNYTDKDGKQITDLERADKIFSTLYTGETKGINADKFTQISKSSDGKEYVFNCKSAMSAGDSAVLFDTVKIPSSWNQTDLAEIGKYTISISAEAIQKSGFENASAAFTALDAEISAKTAKTDYKTVG